MSKSFIITNLCIILFSAIIPYHVNGQEDVQVSAIPVMHELGDWSLSIAPEYTYHPDAHPRIVGSFDVSLFLGKYVSLNGNFAAGQGYLQMGLGIIGIPLIFAMFGPEITSESFGEFLARLVIIGLSFENLNFHIPVSSNFEVSPYISLLRIKYIEEGYGMGEDTNFNFVVGSRMNIFVTDRFFISPFAETTRDWGVDGRWGINAGIHMGFYFYSRW